jgi:hypothetical protein
VKHLLVFAHSFLEPVVNATVGNGYTDHDPLIDIPGPVNHKFAEYTEYGYDQHTFSATAEHGTAWGFGLNKKHHDHICQHIDFDVITDFVMVYHPEVRLHNYQYWANKTQAKIWIAMPWNTHPTTPPEYDIHQVGDYDVIHYGALAYDLLDKGVSPDILFTDEVGHPTPHLSDLCRQYIRYQILGTEPENPIIISRISQKYPEKLQ